MALLAHENDLVLLHVFPVRDAHVTSTKPCATHLEGGSKKNTPGLRIGVYLPQIFIYHRGLVAGGVENPRNSSLLREVRCIPEESRTDAVRVNNLRGGKTATCV